MSKYTGYVWRKNKKDAVNALKYRKKIQPSKIKCIKFNKKKTKYGWKFHATVK